MALDFAEDILAAELACIVEDKCGIVVSDDVVSKMAEKCRAHYRERCKTADDELKGLQAKLILLQAVMDAADAFLATPADDDMPDSRSFNQYTTAGDCRALNKAYHEAVEARESGG